MMQLLRRCGAVGSLLRAYCSYCPTALCVTPAWAQLRALQTTQLCCSIVPTPLASRWGCTPARQSSDKLHHLDLTNLRLRLEVCWGTFDVSLRITGVQTGTCKSFVEEGGGGCRLVEWCLNCVPVSARKEL
jgi:hypothetical protein